MLPLSPALCMPAGSCLPHYQALQQVLTSDSLLSLSQLLEMIFFDQEEARGSHLVQVKHSRELFADIGESSSASNVAVQLPDIFVTPDTRSLEINGLKRFADPTSSTAKRVWDSFVGDKIVVDMS